MAELKLRQRTVRFVRALYFRVLRPAARELRGLVYNAAGADDLAQEGVAAGVMVLAGGIADGG